MNTTTAVLEQRISQLEGGVGALAVASDILTFGVQHGIESGTRFIDALKFITRLVNIGDAISLACHPATTTYHQLNAAEL